MGSRKGLMKKLRQYEIVLPVPKKSTPMTEEQIRAFFEQHRKIRNAGRPT